MNELAFNIFNFQKKIDAPKADQLNNLPQPNFGGWERAQYVPGTCLQPLKLLSIA